MNQDMISWRDYDGLEGFGAGPGMSAQDMEGLNKALTAGNDISNPGASAGAGFPLRVESLERTLKNVTYRMEHVRFWKNIPKLPAYNTVEEHNQISSYGQGDSPFVSEGQLPSEDDSTYERKYATIKFLGTTRRVTHVMSLVKPAHGNVIANETVAGTMWLLRQLERSLFYGDSDLSSLQFDGFQKLISDNAPATNIIDLRGAPLDEDILTDTALTIQDAPNYGVPTHLHLNPKAKSDLIKSFFPKARYDQFSKPDSGMVGLDIKGFTSPAGDVQFEPNVFITDGGAPAVGVVGPTASVPGAPTISSQPTAANDATTQFGAADAGTYTYKVVAHNDYGSTAPVTCSTVAVISGKKVTLIIDEGGGTTKFFSIFRSKPDGTEVRLITRTPRTGASTTFVDRNENLPFCTSGFMWQQNMECMSWKQLAPMIKIPLATIDPSIRWMQLIYGTPVLYAPGKAVWLKNIGRAPHSVGA